MDPVESSPHWTALMWVALIVVGLMQIPALLRLWDINSAVVDLVHWSMNSGASGNAKVMNAHLVRDQLEGVLVSKGGDLQHLRLEVYRSYLGNYLVVSLAEKNLLMANEFFNEGVKQQSAGRRGEAITAFEQAITHNPRLVAAYPRLYAAYLASGRRSESNRLYTQLRALAPSNRIGKSDHGGRWASVPAIELAPSVRFIGYDLLASELPYSREIPITLYWEVDVCEASQVVRSWEGDGWHWISAGSRLYQVGTVENLAPNPGFEMLVLPGGRGYIPGWLPLVLSNWSQPQAEIVLGGNSGRPTNELKLTSLGTPSAFGSMPQPLAIDKSWYLFAGSLSSEAGINSCIRLADDVGTGWLPLLCSHGSEMHAIDASVLVQPVSHATEFSLILVNHSDRGSARYDDLLFTPIDPPYPNAVAPHCS